METRFGGDMIGACMLTGVGVSGASVGPWVTGIGRSSGAQDVRKINRNKKIRMRFIIHLQG
jgi:hypothetical protein